MSSRAAAHAPSRLGYWVTMAMLAVAAAFPVALMVFNPTLMFERGWEQYVGTAIYLWAVATLARELVRVWRNESAFGQASDWIEDGSVPDEDSRVLPSRVRQIARFAAESKSAEVGQLMEVHREGSGLDQEQAAGRFTLTRYILYLLPVIGFIGTVEGISKALMNISLVLPMVKDLDGFMNNLTSVTSALQVAFDSTLLALFLSAALMLVQTLVYRRSEDLLARVDRWVVENVLPRAGSKAADPLALNLAEAIAPHLEATRRDLLAAMEPATLALRDLASRLGEGLGPHVDRFAESVDKLPGALSIFDEGSRAIGRLGGELARLGPMDEGLRRGVGILGRIEVAMADVDSPAPALDEIRRGLDRNVAAVEDLSKSWAMSFERSSRASQDQLARTLNSLKEAVELINVSMEQSNALYRSIVKRSFGVYPVVSSEEEAA